MKDFKGKIAVITGGGTGMGRELACQLVSEGCHVAFCDVLTDNMIETRRLCEAVATEGTRISIHECDVSDEKQVIAFRDAVKRDHQTEYINLLFNNAGVGGGGSFLLDDRARWEKTFNINWFGVYYCTRAFMPMLVASSEGHLINTSSVNGFLACLGANVPHSAYSTSKFAIKGFSESLLIDLRLNAPHVKVSVVMPGYIGTDMRLNIEKIHGDPAIEDMTAKQLSQARERMIKMGNSVENLDDEGVRENLRQWRDDFREKGMPPAEAAAIILDAVRKEEWRVLVGEDASKMDQKVRKHPEEAYSPSFFDF